ncbi:MAG: hypothetical protein K2G12_01725 [Prevotella sp.]|nr:hypothetical protein [Prevotella sp.]
MATIWTRRKEDAARDRRTATPWNTIEENAAASSADGSSTAEIERKAKPQDAKVYNTESPK